VAVLVGLILVGGIAFYENVIVGDSDSAAQPVADSARPALAAQPVAPAPQVRGRGPQSRKGRAKTSGGGAWTPRLGVQNPEDRPDPATIDPTLHFELVARVQSVEPGAAGRNLFAFGAPPPPPAARVPLPANVPKIPISQGPAAPPVQPAVPAGPPPAPVAPQMTFKYYGFKESVADHRKAAFLLDGDVILILGENDTFLKRYRVVRIDRDQISIEDTQFKSVQVIRSQDVLPG